jgi:UDP-3-O-[3-hydroxymyristoyl] glucosamine N-acyltransferase
MAVMTLEEIARATGGNVIGDAGRKVCGVCSTDEASEDMLCVVWDKTLLSSLPDKIPILSSTGTISGRDGIEVSIPRASLVKLLPLFDKRAAYPLGIHPAAHIHERAVVGKNCGIGPGCVISDGAILGDRVFLQANVFIGKDVRIGDDTRIEASVSIQDLVEIGSRVIIHSGASIGCDGFGFIPDDGEWKKIPQIGTVVIEDDVEIGPNCNVDRATFGATRIGHGTKMGACVHIAHNCEIGPDSMMVGFVAFGGSVKTGNRLLVAGMSGIADHVKIGGRVTIAGRSGVTKDIADGETVSGFPAQKHSDEKRFQASLRMIREFGNRLKKLEDMTGK